MDTFVINGGQPISGKIRADGSKNAALPILAGTLLMAEGQTTIKNVPPLQDIRVMLKLLASLGAVVEYDEDDETVTVDASNLTGSVASYELVSQMRGAFVALGPLLARLGEATISLPGGCSLGARPVDYHIKGLKAMGAEISEENGYVTAKRTSGGASLVCFDRQSHTGTENIMFAAALGTGNTTIINAACDPEVVDVANFLNAAGAKIRGAGTGQIEIQAVSRLAPITYTVSGDRLVAGTYLFAAACTGGDIEITGAAPDSLTMVLEKLSAMGCQVNTSDSTIKLKAPGRLTATDAVTYPFPGFPTDLQPCIMAAMTVAEGSSRLRETIFEDRFGHAMELRRLGADISISSDECLINGVDNLRGATVMAGDIRAGAGLVIAALAAGKQSVVSRVYHIDRGYARLDEKLRSLGANIERRASSAQ
ncbi:MAG: UDP-N-acetylglucosamine 1-carboxyvinyltransferase [candidate division Zixibacteria bacterium]|nr:UDP-N-acetylglucosamine 1-carboxyvinyltransferase [candidate division Zixibacteria bacterium]